MQILLDNPWILLVGLGLLPLVPVIPFRWAWVVLLAWGASGALLSFSLAGLPWVNGFLPHALALWIVLDARLRRRWLATVVLCLVASELPWHVYELGKTACLVFLLGAFLVSEAPLGIRGLAATARRAPVAARLALRDLARYQARSGAALAATILLALLITLIPIRRAVRLKPGDALRHA